MHPDRSSVAPPPPPPPPPPPTTTPDPPPECKKGSSCVTVIEVTWLRLDGTDRSLELSTVTEP